MNGYPPIGIVKSNNGTPARRWYVSFGGSELTAEAAYDIADELRAAASEAYKRNQDSDG